MGREKSSNQALSKMMAAELDDKSRPHSELHFKTTNTDKVSHSCQIRTKAAQNVKFLPYESAGFPVTMKPHVLFASTKQKRNPP